MTMRVGIVGISGFGGAEMMRLIAGHPTFELVYAAGEGSAGSRLIDLFPGAPQNYAEMVIEKWNPKSLPAMDLLFISMPTGASAKALAGIPQDLRVIDIGGDHRYADGWVYGLSDVWPERIIDQKRVAIRAVFRRRY